VRILHVCTGNICRSPMAEHLMRTALAQQGVVGIEVSSAGTHGLQGYPVQEHAGSALASRGIDAGAFRASRLTADLVAEADLVLTATREHRAAAVTLSPRAAARTFTLREFDRLLSLVDPATLPGTPLDRAVALVPAAAAQRGLARPEHPGDDDISDPYGGPPAGYPPCAELIEASMSRWLTLVSG
jgi:protein-tyrosine phosphatase